MIVVSILEARNVCKSDLTNQSKDTFFVEARFNKECLTSDRVSLVNTNPKLMTKLCWELSRKFFQVFRKERKPIKLQCFIENNFNEKQLVGYTVLDLRSAQESLDPKFEWRPLLNTKYKGPSHLRPELLLALQFIASNENQDFDFNRRDTDCRLLSQNKSFQVSENLENDINVLIQDGVYRIWDSKKNYINSSRHLILTILLSNFAHLDKLVNLPTELEKCFSFHFSINIFRNALKTDSFFDLRTCDITSKKIDFYLDVDHISTLKSYFDLYPTFEVQLCDQKSNIFGFFTVSLLHLFSNQINENYFNTIQGTFQFLPNNELFQNKDLNPSIDMTVELKEQDKHYTYKNSCLQEETLLNRNNSLAKIILNNLENSDINHFCLILDIRSITIQNEMLLPLSSCLVQYSYPFFGCKEKFESSAIKASELGVYFFEKGCFEFNFAASLHQLDKTFENIPLILDIIENSFRKTLLGMSKVNLKDIFNVVPFTNEIEIKIKLIPVLNANCEKVAELNLIFSLKNLGLTNSENDLIQKTPISNPKKSINSIDDLLMDAAYEIEVWKENQLKNFKSDLKLKEIECTHVIEDRLKQKELEHENNLKAKLKHVYSLEDKLTQSLKNIDLKQNLLEEKRLSLEKKEKEITSRFQKLDQEITKAISEIKLNYESEANEKLQSLEKDKKKLKEKIVMLEAKLGEKVEEIEKYEQRFNKVNNVSRNLHSNANLQKPELESRFRKEPKKINKVNENNSRNKAIQSAIKTNKIESSPENGKQEFKNTAAVLLAEIKKERTQLLKNGFSRHHPIIREIDSHLNK